MFSRLPLWSDLFIYRIKYLIFFVKLQLFPFSLFEKIMRQTPIQMNRFLLADQCPSLFSGFCRRIFSVAISQKDEAAGHISLGNVPLFHELFAKLGVKGIFCSGYDAGRNA
jgi:hypothetical protein